MLKTPRTGAIANDERTVDDTAQYCGKRAAMQEQEPVNAHGSLWAAINEMREKFDARLRRLEYAVIGLIFITASPKVGGPSAQQLLSAAIHTLGVAGAAVVGAVISVVGLVFALRGHL